MLKLEEFAKAVTKASGIKTPQFVCLRGYQNQKGQISDYNLLLGTNHENAKKRDLETLQSFELNADSFAKHSISMEDATKALNELVASLRKNTGDYNGRTNQSKVTSETYHNIAPNIKVHKETKEVYVTGMAVEQPAWNSARREWTEAEYKAVGKEKPVIKPVNSRPKTIAKRIIAKQANLSNAKFREFFLSEIPYFAIDGDVVTIKLQ